MLRKIIYLLTSCLLLTIITSCHKHFKLKEKDLEYIPYKGIEVLVFQSDKNRMDTIFLNGLKQFNGCNDPLAVSSDQCDGVSLSCTRSDPDYDRYLEGQQLVELVATHDDETHISFDIVMKGSWFYNMDSYSLLEFNNMSNSELIIGDSIYNDVKIIEASEYAKQFEQRDNYAERFYWSVSKGFLGLDRRGEKSRLVRIYEL